MGGLLGWVLGCWDWVGLPALPRVFGCLGYQLSSLSSAIVGCKLPLVFIVIGNETSAEGQGMGLVCMCAWGRKQRVCYRCASRVQARVEAGRRPVCVLNM